MTYKFEEETQEQEAQLLKERRNTYCRDVRDFMRTGDSVILKRIIFRTFINSPTPEYFKNDKAQAVMLTMASDRSINMALNFGNNDTLRFA